ncbi:hypothetical protein PAECIP111894_03508 [Paenibacillus pseudetheri]|uniref:Uncharacterized protein n=1 Tax=Paenibacillus pseudetheri TaxID=2897682 RepID=A0ABM9BEY8_9BACL|nr:hypothetical protein PAECIP111894_03508 [Paenibacillus pseudetheri]
MIDALWLRSCLCRMRELGKRILKLNRSCLNAHKTHGFKSFSLYRTGNLVYPLLIACLRKVVLTVDP